MTDGSVLTVGVSLPATFVGIASLTAFHAAGAQTATTTGYVFVGERV